MKFLLVLLVVLIAAWAWRSSRRAISQNEKENFERENERQTTQKTMVACAHCGVHLPQAEALAAPSADLRSQQWFCSTEHRQRGVKVPS